AFEPPDAAAIQSEGRGIVASTVPASASVMFVGGAPVRSFSTALAPMAASMASSFALRTATDSFTAMAASFLRGVDPQTESRALHSARAFDVEPDHVTGLDFGI